MSARLAATEDWQVVPFGTRLHVTHDAGADLTDWLARHATDLDCRAQEIASGLEDLFISLMRREGDRVD